MYAVYGATVDYLDDTVGEYMFFADTLRAEPEEAIAALDGSFGRHSHQRFMLVLASSPPFTFDASSPGAPVARWELREERGRWNLYRPSGVRVVIDNGLIRDFDDFETDADETTLARAKATATTDPQDIVDVYNAMLGGFPVSFSSGYDFF